MKKVLYHVTQKKNLPSIMKKGLVPQVGPNTDAGHGDDENPAEPLVYLLDKPASGLLNKTAVTLAIKTRNYNIYYFDGHGIEGPEGYQEEGDYPVGIEPGDYFTYDTIDPEDITLVDPKTKKPIAAFLVRNAS